MDSADNRLGLLPKADQANQFGEWWDAFFKAWETYKTRESCWPAFMSCIGIAWANRSKDKTGQFQEAYDSFDFEKCGHNQMVALLWEARAMNVRLNWYTWRQEEREELLVP